MGAGGGGAGAGAGGGGGGGGTKRRSSRLAEISDLEMERKAAEKRARKEESRLAKLQKERDAVLHRRGCEYCKDTQAIVDNHLPSLRVIGELCIKKGLPGGDPCWMGRMIGEFVTPPIVPKLCQNCLHFVDCTTCQKRVKGFSCQTILIFRSSAMFAPQHREWED